jgi:hypothetical protein
MSILMQCHIGLADFSFEIDDAGNPYWIITKYAKKWVFGKKPSRPLELMHNLAP